MFDPFLFARCLSQAFQGCLIVAFCAAWARRTGRTSVVAGIRSGVIAAVPLTIVASWLFGQTSYQARWEAGLAAIALCLSAYFAAAIWRHDDDSVSLEQGTGVLAVCVAGTVIIIVRQMMEIGVVLKA